MIVYVVAEETNFQLVGGITDGDWQELSGAGGGGISTVETITATGSLTEDPDRTSRIILVDATSGSVVITLPPSSATTIGTSYQFKRIDNVEANIVTIQRAGSDTIDEGNSQTLPFQWSRMTIKGLTATSWGVF